MLGLVSVYAWPILAGLIAAPTLALLGAQLAARDQAMQTLCVSQGALVGVLYGIGLINVPAELLVGSLGPFFFALLASSGAYLATDALIIGRPASKNTNFAFVFAVLSATSYLVMAIFPALESHLAQVYFGDLATMSGTHSAIVLSVSGAALFLLVRFRRGMARQAFDLAIFGKYRSAGVAETWGFKVISLFLLCFSVQFVGFLFTLAMLFLPTAMMKFLKTKGLALHLSLCAGVAGAGTLVGFLVSLHFSDLPTVPTIVAVAFFLSCCVLLVDRVVHSIVQLPRLKTILTIHPSSQGSL